ncbi:hypothetical protein MHI32_09575 [Paenibacillus sp. FSL H7-0690]|uniref:hypothetical protein n=1 Tax=Paenibacillus sp. FSL H7-0690 TaxID=2921437 RepID=UPI0030EE601F
MDKPKNAGHRNNAEEYVGYIREVITGKMTVEVYFNKKRDGAGRYSKPWPELDWVRRYEMDLYCKFLLKLDLNHRRIVLSRYEILGYTVRELSNYFRIHRDQMRKFIGIFVANEKKKEKREALIRDVIPVPGEFEIDARIIALLAVMMRVPVSWLEQENPSQEWTISHYTVTEYQIVNKDELLNKLQNINSCVYHDVLPIILIFDGVELHLRLESKNGDFILEYVDECQRFGVFRELIKFLGDRVKKTGYVKTVILTHLNLAIIGGNQLKIMPPEFMEVNFNPLAKS